MTKNAWKTLSQGPSGGLVLAVDFSTTGRALAGFHDLVPKLDLPVTVWETLPPAAGQVDPRGYVDWWLSEIRQTGQPVRAVFGYCAGAVLAAQMNEAIAGWQEKPLLLVLDPELPNTVGLYRDFHTAAGAMAELLSEEEMGEFHEAGRKVQEKYGDADLRAVGSALGEVFNTAMNTAGERLGLDEEIRAELAGIFDTLVQYLVAATTFDPLPIWAQSIAIRSRSLGKGAPVGHEIKLDVPHQDLLRHDLTARAVADVLAGRAGTNGI